MITRFTNYKLITEDPDYVWDEEIEHGYSCHWNEARAFTVDTNEDHSEVEDVYFGPPGGGHCHMDYQGRRRSYPGRLWLKSKIIAFWVYPNDQLFKSLINKIEEKLGIKIFNNGWRIEIQKIDDKIKKKDKDSFDFYQNDGGYENAILIPIEEYTGSKDVPDEQRKMHLMGWKEKELAKRAGLINLKGWGSDRTAWDQPKNLAYRQTIHQENKKQE